MITSNFEAVIFDCDGTLVDSEPITVAVLIDYVKEFGLELDFDEASNLFVGRDMQTVAQWLNSRTQKQLPDIFAEEFRRRQAIRLRESVKPISGAAELLTSMAKLTKPFCVASNAPREKIEINLTVTELDSFFTDARTFSAYDINVWKPRPDLFFHAAKQMNIAPADCVVIEDSLAGIEAGLAAGMQVIGYSKDAQSKPTDEVPFVHCLSALVEHLA
jgi:HAD superfamily hydrolase (TIGR01509 family)